MAPNPIHVWVRDNYPYEYAKIITEHGVGSDFMEQRAAWLMLSELGICESTARQRDVLLTSLAEAADADYPTEKEWRIMQRVWRGHLSYAGEE